MYDSFEIIIEATFIIFLFSHALFFMLILLDE